VTRKVGTPRAAKKRADTYFSKIIRARDQHCQACSSEENLQCAHIFSRRFSNTRCDMENAVCLCAKCHHYFTDKPTEWGRWVLGYMGEDHYEALLARSMVVSPRFDWEAKADELREIWRTFQ